MADDWEGGDWGGGFDPGDGGPGYDSGGEGAAPGPGGVGDMPAFDSKDMQVDPDTGDVYDKYGQYVGNINDPQFGGNQSLWDAKSGGSDSGFLSQLAKALGLGPNSSLPMLLSALGIGAGGYMNSKATSKATGQMTDAVKQANAAITQILGGAQGAYKPYTDLGPVATQRLLNAPQSNLAGQFGPLGSGKGIGGSKTFSSLIGR